MGDTSPHSPLAGGYRQQTSPYEISCTKSVTWNNWGMGEPLGSIRRGSRLFANWKYMEYFHFVTDVRAIFVFTLDFQFELDLREYSSMYLKSRGGDFFFIRKSFYFERT